MGLFDSFKKKVEEKSEVVNPLYSYLKDAGLPIENLQVVESNGSVTVSGVSQNGEALTLVEDLLKGKGITNIQNNISVADLSNSGVTYKVTTRGSNLNCRRGPGVDNEIAGKFANGSVVTLVQKYNDTWHKVKNTDVEGYCHTDYLESMTNT